MFLSNPSAVINPAESMTRCSLMIFSDRTAGPDRVDTLQRRKAIHWARIDAIGGQYLETKEGFTLDKQGIAVGSHRLHNLALKSRSWAPNQALRGDIWV